MNYNDEWPDPDGAGHSRRRKKFKKPTERVAPNLSPQEWDEKARAILLSQLSRSAKTKKQLAQILEKRFVPAEIAGPLLDRFEEVHLIDDAAYARAFTHDRRISRGLSKTALKRELNQAGISAELVDDALENITQDDDVSLAMALVRKRWSSVSKLERDARYRRLSGFLGRRGFSGAAVGAAISTVEREQLEA